MRRIGGARQPSRERITCVGSNSSFASRALTHAYASWSMFLSGLPRSTAVPPDKLMPKNAPPPVTTAVPAAMPPPPAATAPPPRAANDALASAAPDSEPIAVPAPVAPSIPSPPAVAAIAGAARKAAPPVATVTATVAHALGCSTTKFFTLIAPFAVLPAISMTTLLAAPPALLPATFNEFPALLSDARASESWPATSDLPVNAHYCDAS